ncbi:hypothetical protein AMECASPLE_023948 [Ameca splendens]|uniref:Uncharacterized protein n=1 Tax=Ameca splendens TaxID=208324 RepID=A0ABV0YGF2_9TELE
MSMKWSEEMNRPPAPGPSVCDCVHKDGYLQASFIPRHSLSSQSELCGGRSWSETDLRKEKCPQGFSWSSVRFDIHCQGGIFEFS